MNTEPASCQLLDTITQRFNKNISENKQPYTASYDKTDNNLLLPIYCSVFRHQCFRRDEEKSTIPDVTLAYYAVTYATRRRRSDALSISLSYSVCITLH